MHELPITQQIIKLASDHAMKNGATRVMKINLVIGEYSGFIGDAIAMYFDLISQGTIVEGAQLSIQYVKPLLKCTNCGELFERRKFSFECPSCHGEGIPTEIGKEFHIESIEVET